VNKNRIIFGIFAALVIVAGGLYGINHVNACDGCAAHAKADAATTAKVESADAKVSTVNSSGKACCPSGKTTATTASATTDAKAVQAGASCDYNAKTASAGCTSADKANAKLAGTKCDSKGEMMTAETAMAKLAKCGIDVRAYETDMLATKLAGTECCGITFTQEKWASLIKSAKALDAEQADVIVATASQDKPCKGDDCSFVKVAQDLASQTEEVQKSVN
jgi:hypothetical protein